MGHALDLSTLPVVLLFKISPELYFSGNIIMQSFLGFSITGPIQVTFRQLSLLGKCFNLQNWLFCIQCGSLHLNIFESNGFLDEMGTLEIIDPLLY